jgi:hypothetical protein
MDNLAGSRTILLIPPGARERNGKSLTIVLKKVPLIVKSKNNRDSPTASNWSSSILAILYKTFKRPQYVRFFLVLIKRQHLLLPLRSLIPYLTTPRFTRTNHP